MKIKNTQKPQYSQNENMIKKTYSKENELVKREVLAVQITTANKEDILEYIVDSVKNSFKNYYIVTPNPEMVVYAASHPNFATILNSAELALCDGVGLFWGARALGRPLKERFTGVELVEKLCAKANRQPITVGFFGGKPGVAEIASDCLLQKHPDLKVAYVSDGASEGYPDFQSPLANKVTLTGVASQLESNNNTTSKREKEIPPVDILFVALGFPKQEEWMASHLNKIPVRVMVGVGGAFDYISGRVPRAPKWVQNIGLEWLFRLVVQPWRIKRQLALPQFVWMVLREKMFLGK